MPEVLLVCRANLCRSPAAELMLRAALGSGTAVAVSSAGVRAVPGSAVPGDFADLLAARGVDASQHRSRRADRTVLDAAELVVVMTRSQRTAVTTAAPATVRRTLLLTEAADRIRSDGGGGLQVVPGAVPVEDVADPYGLPTDQAEAVLDLIQHEVGRFAAALRAAAP